MEPKERNTAMCFFWSIMVLFFGALEPAGHFLRSTVFLLNAYWTVALTD